MSDQPEPKTYRLTLGAERPTPKLRDYRMPSRYPELPFDEPALGSLTIEDKVFVLSGDFPSGRREIEASIIARGGVLGDVVNHRTAYVIVGELPSRGWKFGNYGNKIDRALEDRKMSGRPLLLRESHWLQQIDSPQTTESLLDSLSRGGERSILLLHSFESGYSDGWACCLPAAFRAALDIRQTLRKELGVDRLVWTQGVNFEFALGDVIHDSREAYEKSWGDALQTMTFSLQVRSFTPDGIGFDVLVPDDERKKLVVQQQNLASPIEFVRLLITGSCRPLRPAQ